MSAPLYAAYVSYMRDIGGDTSGRSVRAVSRAQVDAAMQRRGVEGIEDPALRELATSRAALRINAAVGDREVHSDLALSREHGVAARYGRIGESLAETAQIEESGPEGLEELIAGSLPEDPILRAPGAMTAPGHALHTPSEAARRIAADLSLDAVARAEALAAAGEDPVIIDLLCYERARVSAALDVRADGANPEPSMSWAGMWVLTLNGLYALRFDARPDAGAPADEAVAAFQAVAVGDVMQQLVGRVGAALGWLSERDRAEGGEQR